jgi:hypothetical protein
MSNKMGPAADERSAAQKARRDKLIDYQAKEDLRWLLQQPQFRRWAVGLIYAGEFCGVNKTIFQTSNLFAFLEGRRAVGVDVLRTFSRFPELYSQFEHDRVEAELEQLKRMKEDDNA